MTPEETLKVTKGWLANMAEASSKAVYVGYPQEKVGSKVYKNGDAVIDIVVHHEYGAPRAGIPMRSILRVPFEKNQDQLKKSITSALKRVLNGDITTQVGLGLVGVSAQKIAQGAFLTKGYGSWAELKPATIAAKGRSSILITTGTIRNSLTWVVR